MRTFFCMLLVLLAGCASTGPAELTSAQQAAACGPYPENYETLVKDRLERTLFDPYSAHVKLQAPVRCWERGGVLNGSRASYGWIVHASINAKNRMGAYTGLEDTCFLLRGGRIIAELSPISIENARQWGQFGYIWEPGVGGYGMSASQPAADRAAESRSPAP